jgi:hypothetical protein
MRFDGLCEIVEINPFMLPPTLQCGARHDAARIRILTEHLRSCDEEGFKGGAVAGKMNRDRLC